MPKSICIEDHVNLKEANIQFEELSEKFRNMLAIIPEIIPKVCLDQIVDALPRSFYANAYRELSKSILKKDQQISNKSIERISNLLKKAREFSNDSTARKLFIQEQNKDQHLRVIKPKSAFEDYIADVSFIGNCWMLKGSELGQNQMQQCAWLKADINVGGCVYLFNEEKSLKDDKKKFFPTSMTRVYIAVDRKDVPIIYIDSIEGGTLHWDQLADWVGAGRGKELVYNIAGAIFIAKEFGIDRIAMGEREAQDLAFALGFKEERLFDKENKEKRMVGYPGDRHGYDGPYSLRILCGEEKRVVRLSELEDISKEEIIKTLAGISSSVSSNKRGHKNIKKELEISLFLDCIEGLFKECRNPMDGVEGYMLELRKSYPYSAILSRIPQNF